MRISMFPLVMKKDALEGPQSRIQAREVGTVVTVFGLHDSQNQSAICSICRKSKSHVMLKKMHVGMRDRQSQQHARQAKNPRLEC